MTTIPESPQSMSEATAGDGSKGTADMSGRWILRPERTSVRFRSSSLRGLIKVRGRFTSVRGEAKVGSDGTVTGRVVIDATSISTGIKRRDAHLRSADFFDTSRYPEISYDLAQAVLTGSDEMHLVGTLSIAGKSRPVELDVAIRDRDDHGVTLVVATTLDRSKWDINWDKMCMKRMATGVEVAARFVRAT